MRVKKWYSSFGEKERGLICTDLVDLILNRRTDMGNIMEFGARKVVYRRYASLVFCFGIDHDDNELIVLEIIHRYVELLDRYYGNVCELDVLFNYKAAYYILDELLIGGEMVEPSKKLVSGSLRLMEMSEQEERAGVQRMDMPLF